MAKKFSGKKLAHGKRASTDPTFSIDAVTGLFDRETGDPDWKAKAAYKQFPNTDEIFNSDMWHRVRPVKSGVRKSFVLPVGEVISTVCPLSPRFVLTVKPVPANCFSTSTAAIAGAC